MKDKLEKIVSKHLLSANGPGYSVSVELDGKPFFKHYLGYANLDYDIPINAKTVFNTASLIKQFTAFSIAILACEKRLSLDDSVCIYCPDFDEKIKIKHLIYHTSGIEEPHFEPGEYDIYSNDGYDILGDIAAKAAGMDMHEFTKQRIFDPLGMSNADFRIDTKVIIKNCATAYGQRGNDSYDYQAGNDSFELFDNRPYPSVGSDGLWTTADDLAAWHNCLMNRNLPGAPAGVFDLLFSPFTLNDGKLNQFGFGFFYDKDNRDIIWQHGDCSGWQSVIRAYLKERLSIVVLSNCRQAKPVELALDLENAVIAELFGLPEQINYLSEYWDARNRIQFT